MSVFIFLFILRHHKTIIHNEPTLFFDLLLFFINIHYKVYLNHLYKPSNIFLTNLFYFTFSFVFKRFSVFLWKNVKHNYDQKLKKCSYPQTLNLQPDLQSLTCCDPLHLTVAVVPLFMVLSRLSSNKQQRRCHAAIKRWLLLQVTMTHIFTIIIV